MKINGYSLIFGISTIFGLVNLEQWSLDKAQQWYNEQGKLDPNF
jgi:hypothetical protein